MKDSAGRPTKVPELLRAELDRSQDDLASGRTSPVSTVLTDIHTRAMKRIDEKRLGLIAVAEEQRPFKAD